MPRKKKNETNTSVKDDGNRFIYCGLRKCIHIECLRHNVNTPFDVLILRRNFNPDKDWNCKDMEV